MSLDLICGMNPGGRYEVFREMDGSVRKVVAPFVLGAVFIASLFLSDVLDAGVVFVAVGTIVAVVLSHLVWPSPVFVVALVMLVVATLLPISGMYIVGNSGEQEVSFSEVLNLIVWWKNVVPLTTAIITACALKHLRFRMTGAGQTNTPDTPPVGERP